VADSSIQGLTTSQLAHFCSSQAFTIEALILDSIGTSYFSIGPISVENLILKDSVLNEPQDVLQISGQAPAISNNLFRYSFNGQPSIQLMGSENVDQILLFSNNSWTPMSMTSTTSFSTVNFQKFWGIIDFGVWQALDIISIDYLNMTGSLSISKEIRSLNSGCAMLTAADDSSHLFLYSIGTQRVEFNIVHGTWVYYPDDPSMGIQSLDLDKPSSWVLRNAPSVFFPSNTVPDFHTEYIIAENVTIALDTVIQNDTGWQVTIAYHHSSKELAFLVIPHPSPSLEPYAAPTIAAPSGKGSTLSPSSYLLMILLNFLIFM
jgi:hypothetical protein